MPEPAAPEPAAPEPAGQRSPFCIPSMSTTSDLNATLRQTRATLADWKAKIRALRDDPVIVAWEGMDNDNLLAQLTAFGITEDCNAIRKKIKPTAASLDHQVDVLDNEAGRLLTELEMSGADPSAIKPLQERLAAEQGALHKQVASLLAAGTALRHADATVRGRLGLQTLLRAAARCAENKGSFQAGAKALVTLVGDGSGEPSQLERLERKADDLAIALRDLPLPGDLPESITSAWEHYIDLVRSALDQIKDHLTGIRKQSSDMFLVVEELPERLAGLTRLPIARLLAAFNNEASTFAGTVARFDKQAKHTSALPAIDNILSDVALFLKACKETVPNAIQQALEDNSNINPDRLAAVEAKTFFNGLGGLIRMVRLLGTSLVGGRMITERELAELLASILRQCTLLGRVKKRGAPPCQRLITDMLQPFKRPFPHDDIARLATRLVNRYSFTLDKFFATLPVPEKGGQNDGQDKKTVEFGKLVGRIEVRTATVVED